MTFLPFFYSRDAFHVSQTKSATIRPPPHGDHRGQSTRRRTPVGLLVLPRARVTRLAVSAGHDTDTEASVVADGAARVTTEGLQRGAGARCGERWEEGVRGVCGGRRGRSGWGTMSESSSAGTDSFIFAIQPSASAEELTARDGKGIVHPDLACSRRGPDVLVSERRQKVVARDSGGSL